MPTSDQRAKDVCARITLLPDWRNREAIIAQAIRDAENAALDKAAAHVEQFAPAISASAELLPGMEKVVERLAEMVAVSIPGEIRSLKHRDAA